ERVERREREPRLEHLLDGGVRARLDHRARGLAVRRTHALAEAVVERVVEVEHDGADGGAVGRGRSTGRFAHAVGRTLASGREAIEYPCVTRRQGIDVPPPTASACASAAGSRSPESTTRTQPPPPAPHGFVPTAPAARTASSSLSIAGVDT